MIISLKILTLLAISLSAVSGMITLHVHRKYFREFELKDLFNGRFDSWLFVANTITTASAVSAFGLSLIWFSSEDWEPNKLAWVIILNVWHIFVSLGVTAFHYITYVLLQDAEICRLCKQPKKK
jgi:hypothetical protein